MLVVWDVSMTSVRVQCNNKWLPFHLLQGTSPREVQTMKKMMMSMQQEHNQPQLLLKLKLHCRQQAHPHLRAF